MPESRENQRAAARRWAVMGGCLILGVLAGVLFGRTLEPPPGPVVVGDGAMRPRGALAGALDHQLALDAGSVRIGISFRDAQGRWCRTFEDAPERLAGLACRERGGWRVLALAAWTPPSQTGLRSAASETPQMVTAAVDQTISGTPADQAGERAARDRGWAP